MYLKQRIGVFTVLYMSLFSFPLCLSPGLGFLWAARWVFLRPTAEPSPCSLFLFLCTYYFGYFMFLVVCVFSLSGLCPWVAFFWFPLESWFPWLLNTLHAFCKNVLFFTKELQIFIDITYTSYKKCNTWCIFCIHSHYSYI